MISPLALTIVSALGVLVSTVQFSAPLKVLMECRRNQHLGSLNPTPLGVAMISLTSWLIYGVALRSLSLILSTLVGLVVSFFSVTTTLTLLGLERRQVAARNLELLLFAGLAMWVIIGVLVGTVIEDPATAVHIYGGVCTTVSLLYYSSPLSTVLVIVRTGDSSSLYLPSLVLNLAGGLLWGIFGLATNNPNLIGPNAIGICLTLSQIALKVRYHKPLAGDGGRPPSASGSSSGSEGAYEYPTIDIEAGGGGTELVGVRSRVAGAYSQLRAFAPVHSASADIAHKGASGAAGDDPSASSMHRSGAEDMAGDWGRDRALSREVSDQVVHNPLLAPTAPTAPAEAGGVLQRRARGASLTGSGVVSGGGDDSQSSQLPTSRSRRSSSLAALADVFSSALTAFEPTLTEEAIAATEAALYMSHDDESGRGSGFGVLGRSRSSTGTSMADGVFRFLAPLLPDLSPPLSQSPQPANADRSRGPSLSQHPYRLRGESSTTRSRSGTVVSALSLSVSPTTGRSRTGSPDNPPGAAQTYSIWSAGSGAHADGSGEVFARAARSLSGATLLQAAATASAAAMSNESSSRDITRSSPPAAGAGSGACDVMHSTIPEAPEEAEDEDEERGGGRLFYAA